MPLSAQHDMNLEQTDKSLFKRLQYAKEILVQMMSVASMPASLALTNLTARPEEQVETDVDCAVANTATYQSSQKMVPAMQQHQSSARHTKSASKCHMMMSPYTSKTKQMANSKEPQATRSYRMQTMTAQKASTGNNLLCSGVKQSSSKGRFELPMLSNRSNSKQTLGAVRNMSQTGKQVTSTSFSSSHNFLPSKIAAGMTAQPL